MNYSLTIENSSEEWKGIVRKDLFSSSFKYTFENEKKMFIGNLWDYAYFHKIKPSVWEEGCNFRLSNIGYLFV